MMPQLQALLASKHPQRRHLLRFAVWTWFHQTLVATLRGCLDTSSQALAPHMP